MNLYSASSETTGKYGKANGECKAFDTTYLHFFEYRGLPYQINLLQTSDRYTISLTASIITVTADSSAVEHGGRPLLIVQGFTAASSQSSTLNLPLDFSIEQFKTAIARLMLAHSTASGISETDLLSLYRSDGELNTAITNSYIKIKSENLNEVLKQRSDSIRQAKTEEVRQLNVEHQRTIDSLLGIIDLVDEESRYGGQFEKSDPDSIGVPVFTSSSRNRRAFNTDSVRFYANEVYVKTFNNFIDVIHVNGVVWYNGKSIPVNFYNGSYSIPLKHLYLRNQYLALRIPYELNDTARSGKTAYGKIHPHRTYLVNLSDILRMNPYRNHYTFMAKNGSYLLNYRDSIIRYERRTFYDYLNFTTFLDFLGTVEKTPNSLIQIEGRIRLPLKLTNTRFLGKDNYIFPNVFFPRLDAYLNASFINGSQTDNRYGTVFNKSSNSANLDTLYIDNFDLVRKNNIRTGLELGVFKSEMKGSNINMYIDYGLHFTRTSLLYTIVNTTSPDELNRFNSWSVSHGPILRFEYRPDQNLGMDLSFSANLRQKLLNSDNENLKVYEVEGPLNPNRIPEPGPLDAIPAARTANYKVEFNTYFMVNPARSNGGLYFRLSNYFSSDFKQLFPQVLVGYSTRLSGMIKNIRDKSNE